LDRASDSERQQYNEQRVEAQGFLQMAMHKGGKRACSTAPWAFNPKKLMKGASRPEACLSGWIKEYCCAEQNRSGRQRICKEAATMRLTNQMAAPR
jgi:hypothetical protein